jgi:hypothetical protein
MADNTVHSWPGMAIELFDHLTGRNAEITYHLENMEVHVPTHLDGQGNALSYAIWKFNGALRISSRLLEGK